MIQYSGYQLLLSWYPSPTPSSVSSLPLPASLGALGKADTLLHQRDRPIRKTSHPCQSTEGTGIGWGISTWLDLGQWHARAGWLGMEFWERYFLSLHLKDLLYQKGCFFPSDQRDATMSPGTPAAILPAWEKPAWGWTDIMEEWQRDGKKRWLTSRWTAISHPQYSPPRP